MDFALKQYIDYNQDYKGIPVYNQPFWKASEVDPIDGINSVNIALDKNELRTFIVIHKISISATGLGLSAVFKDIRSTDVLFEFNNQLPLFSIQPFEHVIKGNLFRMTCSDLDFKFSLFAQTVTQEKER